MQTPKTSLSVGLDIGSTTVKLVILDPDYRLIFKRYERHLSDIKTAVTKLLDEANSVIFYGGSVSPNSDSSSLNEDSFQDECNSFHTSGARSSDEIINLGISGSGGIGLAQALNVPFTQEVISCTKAIKHRLNHVDVAIELGGEDGKITYFGKSGETEQRMNGMCAGGTGAFIDQMVTLLRLDEEGQKQGKSGAALMNELASQHTTIYPIASRCGVFAKTDVQALINDGASKTDISASVFNAVVMQTIAGLACGRPIKGKVAYLGGPLTFLSELRHSFSKTLHLDEEKDVVFPQDSLYFVAIGAALTARETAIEEYEHANSSLTSNISQASHLFPVHDAALASSKETHRTTWDSICHRLHGHLELTVEKPRFEPLFASKEEYEAFRERHSRCSAAKDGLKEYLLRVARKIEPKKKETTNVSANDDSNMSNSASSETILGSEADELAPPTHPVAPVFLGMDVGSTTTKVLLMGIGGEVLWTSYGSNKGQPLQSCTAGVRAVCAEMERIEKEVESERKSELHKNSEGEERGDESDEESEDFDSPRFILCRSGVTGYGEQLIQTALCVDDGEVETVAHFRAARHFVPKVDFLLDIGGQDMKCLFIKDGAIDRIVLNEACSSGCGSFLETFAHSVHMSVGDFADAGLSSRCPVDLGSRCTVFMNSRVKQVQREGASLADISAGLALSVVKNALFKVMRIKNIAELGANVVVQGGTFLNDAVLRSLERVIGREVVRPDIAAMMGAFGMALIARDKYNSSTRSRRRGEDDERLKIRDAMLAAAKKEQASSSASASSHSVPDIETLTPFELSCMPYRSSLLPPSLLSTFTSTVTTRRCGGCLNNCLLTINCFSDGRQHISGNRCERGAGKTVGSTVLWAEKIEKDQKMEHSKSLLLSLTSSSAKKGANAADDCAQHKLTLLPSLSIASTVLTPIKVNSLPNLHDFKQRRIFSYYKPLPSASATRGVIGIPRVLNMYDEYPFWFTLFTSLGVRVELSGLSTAELYKSGADTIPSDTMCYPAKLIHGHVLDLIQKKHCKRIFYPGVLFTRTEGHRSTNVAHCPVVSLYPDILPRNLDLPDDVECINPFLPVHQPDEMLDRCMQHLAPTLSRLPSANSESEQKSSSSSSSSTSSSPRPVKKSEMAAALSEAYAAWDLCRADIAREGERALCFLAEHPSIHGVVLAGRPYHIDREISHGMAGLVQSLGCVVLSEDSISERGRAYLQRPLRVLDPVYFHTRLYQAAAFVARQHEAMVDVLADAKVQHVKEEYYESKRMKKEMKERKEMKKKATKGNKNTEQSEADSSAADEMSIQPEEMITKDEMKKLIERIREEAEREIALVNMNSCSSVASVSSRSSDASHNNTLSEPLHDRLHFVQLVSFGCGQDAITTDQVSEILHAHGKDYTQIKIDEIGNLGAVRIRLRSLLAAVAEKEEKEQKEWEKRQKESEQERKQGMMGKGSIDGDTQIAGFKPHKAKETKKEGKNHITIPDSYYAPIKPSPVNAMASHDYTDPSSDTSSECSTSSIDDTATSISRNSDPPSGNLPVMSPTPSLSPTAQNAQTCSPNPLASPSPSPSLSAADNISLSTSAFLVSSSSSNALSPSSSDVKPCSPSEESPSSSSSLLSPLSSNTSSIVVDTANADSPSPPLLSQQTNISSTFPAMDPLSTTSVPSSTHNEKNSSSDSLTLSSSSSSSSALPSVMYKQKLPTEEERYSEFVRNGMQSALSEKDVAVLTKKRKEELHTEEKRINKLIEESEKLREKEVKDVEKRVLLYEEAKQKAKEKEEKERKKTKKMKERNEAKVITLHSDNVNASATTTSSSSSSSSSIPTTTTTSSSSSTPSPSSIPKKSLSAQNALSLMSAFDIESMDVCTPDRCISCFAATTCTSAENVALHRKSREEENAKTLEPSAGISSATEDGSCCSEADELHNSSSSSSSSSSSAVKTTGSEPALHPSSTCLPLASPSSGSEMFVTPLFTETMKKTHVVITPTMSSFSNPFLLAILRRRGYHAFIPETTPPEWLPKGNKEVLCRYSLPIGSPSEVYETSLSLLHNDLCIPAHHFLGLFLHSVTPLSSKSASVGAVASLSSSASPTPTPSPSISLTPSLSPLSSPSSSSSDSALSTPTKPSSHTDTFDSTSSNNSNNYNNIKCHHRPLFDIHRCAFLITQTGSACRAPNYLSSLRRALRDLGAPSAPVIPFASSSKLNAKHPGFPITPLVLIDAAFAFVMGDLLQRLLLRTRPYEAVRDSANSLCLEMMEEGYRLLAKSTDYDAYCKWCKKAINRFQELPLREMERKPLVGIVGEIGVQMRPSLNNFIVDRLEMLGAEVVCFGMMDFLGYCSADDLGLNDEFKKDFKGVVWNKAMLLYYQRLLSPINTLFRRKESRFLPFATGEELFAMMKPHCSPMMIWGEGWLLVAEMVELVEHFGCSNIVVLQPWGCLPNHITGRGFMKQMRERYPGTNIVAIDFDTSGTEVNQINRLVLMLSVAKENMKKKKKNQKTAAMMAVSGDSSVKEVTHELAEESDKASSTGCLSESGGVSNDTNEATGPSPHSMKQIHSEAQLPSNSDCSVRKESENCLFDKSECEVDIAAKVEFDYETKIMTNASAIKGES